MDRERKRPVREISEDERRLKAIEAYFQAYEEYRQLDNVRHHLSADVYGNALIEIHRYNGELRGELVLRVKRKDEDLEGVSAETAAYEWAADSLQDMIKKVSGEQGLARESA